MKKSLVYSPLLFVICVLNGCGAIGTKTTSVSIIYGITAILSLLLLIAYCYLIYQKDIWFLLVFSSVLVVNVGYFCLSISTVLEEALLANRISYLGSVFLPMSMLFIILDILKISFPKWSSLLLFIVGIAIFFISASPGYLTIYYKEVSLQTVNEITCLEKVYGPWHSIYLFYLLTYFSVMVFIIARAIYNHNITSACHSVIFAIAVLINIGVWLIEQLVSINFEMLSVSYIVTELFLLGLNVIMTENENLKKQISPKPTHISAPSSENTQETEENNPEDSISEVQRQLLFNLEKLTKTERVIFDFYIDGRSTKEIMAELKITENTLKFHNKNIYSKLNVSSRKQLIEIYYQS